MARKERLDGFRAPERLTQSFADRVARAGRYGDGWGGTRGLTLLVKRRAAGAWSKTYSVRVKVAGQRDRKTIGLGVHGDGAGGTVTLEAARELARDAWQAAKDGINAAQPTKTTPTFREMVEATIANERDAWKDDRTEREWRSTMRDYASGRIGRRPITEITGADVLAILRPLYRSKPATGRKVRRRVRAVFAFAISEGLIESNPAGDDITAGLPKTNGQTTHRAAVPYADLPAALATVRGSGAYQGAIDAILLTALAGTRTDETRLATWAEIDGRTWTIPGDRRKGSAPLRVPLSDAALDVLERARELDDGSGYVFPSIRANGRPMAKDALLKLYKAHTGATVHGLRSALRDYCAETGVPDNVAEAAMGHALGRNQTEAAYLRTDLVERRRPVMDAWADFLNA